MKRSLRYWPLLAAWGILTVGVALRWSNAAKPPAFDARRPLETLALPPPPGWTVSDAPLGPSELIAGETAQTLDFNDYFYRVYSRGSVAVRVYVAYWAPARIDPSLVAIHRPETCWLVNGARILEHQSQFRLTSQRFGPLLPAEYDRFQFSLGAEEVLFWHRYGQKIFPYHALGGTFLEQHLNPFLHSIFTSGFELQAKDQLVVRISTNGSIGEFLQSDLWKAFSASPLASELRAPSA